MLWIAAVLLLILWALGFFIFHLGDIIHALIVIAVVLVLGNVLRGIGKQRSA
ncbi:MAG: lmo0937 family membrane protein [Chloroflexota bacterium]